MCQTCDKLKSDISRYAVQGDARGERIMRDVLADHLRVTHQQGQRQPETVKIGSQVWIVAENR